MATDNEIKERLLHIYKEAVEIMDTEIAAAKEENTLDCIAYDTKLGHKVHSNGEYYRLLFYFEKADGEMQEILKEAEDAESMCDPKSKIWN